MGHRLLAIVGRMETVGPHSTLTLVGSNAKLSLPETGHVVSLLFEKIVSALWDRVRGHALAYEQVMKGIRHSRQDVNAYTRWLTEGVSKEALDDCRRAWWARRAATRKIREAHSEYPTRYELFHCDSRVVLGLLHAETEELCWVKDISSEVLADMGWQGTDMGWRGESSCCWRAAVRGATMDDGTYRERVFRVSMDKEVVDLL